MPSIHQFTYILLSLQPVCTGISTLVRVTQLSSFSFPDFSGEESLSHLLSHHNKTIHFFSRPTVSSAKTYVESSGRHAPRSCVNVTNISVYTSIALRRLYVHVFLPS